MNPRDHIDLFILENHRLLECGEIAFCLGVSQEEVKERSSALGLSVLLLRPFKEKAKGYEPQCCDPVNRLLFFTTVSPNRVTIELQWFLKAILVDGCTLNNLISELQIGVTRQQVSRIAERLLGFSTGKLRRSLLWYLNREGIDGQRVRVLTDFSELPEYISNKSIRQLSSEIGCSAHFLRVHLYGRLGWKMSDLECGDLK